MAHALVQHFLASFARGGVGAGKCLGCEVFLPAFPQTCPKNLCSAKIPPTNFPSQNWWKPFFKGHTHTS